MTDDQPEDGKRKPDLLERENTWLYSAIAAGFCGLVLFIAGLMWTYTSYDEADEFARKFDVLYRGALIGAALVTFFTVVWRGLVSTRQVDAQTEQLKLIRRQLEHSEKQAQLGERNELAKLLQKGAELLDNNQRSHRYAGMSTLEFVVEQDRDFTQQALTLLGEKYEEIAVDRSRVREAERIRGVIERFHKATGRRVQMQIMLHAPDEHFSWTVAQGFDRIQYFGGDMWGLLGDNQIDDFTRYGFARVKVSFMTLAVGQSFYKCVFQNCEIKAANAHALAHNEFVECDFSGCNLKGHYNLNGKGNYFARSQPPRLQNGDLPAEAWLDENLLRLER